MEKGEIKKTTKCRKGYRNVIVKLVSHFVRGVGLYRNQCKVQSSTLKETEKLAWSLIVVQCRPKVVLMSYANMQEYYYCVLIIIWGLFLCVIPF